MNDVKIEARTAYIKDSMKKILSTPLPSKDIDENCVFVRIGHEGKYMILMDREDYERMVKEGWVMDGMKKSGLKMPVVMIKNKDSFETITLSQFIMRPLAKSGCERRFKRLGHPLDFRKRNMDFVGRYVKIEELGN